MSKRDFDADLALCENASPGPWKPCECSYAGACQGRGLRLLWCDGVPHEADETFAAAARTGWPAAIRRVNELEASDQEWTRLALAVRAADESGDDGALGKALWALYEQARGNGWTDLPEPLVKQVLDREEALAGRVAELEVEVARLQRQCAGHCERIAAASEVLSKCAEKGQLCGRCAACGGVVEVPTP